MDYKNLPVKVLQIGEGNFLRAFAEYIIETADSKGIFNSSVIISQARGSDFCNIINDQNCEYNILTRGNQNSETVDSLQKITCVKECINPKTNFDKVIDTAKSDSLEVIISNTTEAGITYNSMDKYDDKPPISYPAKLTVLLFERFKKFNGNADKGLLILPVELIEKNGDKLKEIVLRYTEEWSLGTNFSYWINNYCCFANTLVDRIVSGHPKENLNELFSRCGFEDNCLVACEPFLFWAIECPEKFRSIFPVDKIGLNIVYSDDITPYKIRKVRILNGAHTMSVLAAYLCGHDTVREMMQDEAFNAFIKKALHNEIMPTINFPKAELESFANSVLERFDNPFIKHKLLDISLNSVSKFNARCLGSMQDYIKIYNKLPLSIVFGLSALIKLYSGELCDGKFIGKRANNSYEIHDSEDVISFFAKKPSVEKILSNTSFWGVNLCVIDGLCEAVQSNLDNFEKIGIYQTMKKI